MLDARLDNALKPKKHQRDGSFDDIFSFVFVRIWIDDPMDGSVIDACNSGELSHADSATDGFSDKGLALVFRQCRECTCITIAQ